MKKKEIYIEKGPYDDKILECCINGKVFVIKRGEKVKVDEEIFDFINLCGLGGKHNEC